MPPTIVSSPPTVNWTERPLPSTVQHCKPDKHPFYNSALSLVFFIPPSLHPPPHPFPILPPSQKTFLLCFLVNGKSITQISRCQNSGLLFLCVINLQRSQSWKLKFALVAPIITVSIHQWSLQQIIAPTPKSSVNVLDAYISSLPSLTPSHYPHLSPHTDSVRRQWRGR